MIFEWIQPIWLLAFVPLMGLWWWLRKSKASNLPIQEVSSVELWKRLDSTPLATSHWLNLVPILILVLASAGPRFIEAPSSKASWSHNKDGSLRLDFVTESNASPVLLDPSELANLVVDSNSLGTLHTAFFPDLPAGTAISFDIGGSLRKFNVPKRPPPVKLYCAEATGAIETILTAMTTEGWIERVPKSQAAAADLIIGDFDSDPTPHIAFYSSPTSIWLPSPIVSTPLDPILEGIGPETWTITAAHAVPVGIPILETETGEALLTRTPQGFVWGFDPEAGDLADRSDWPLLMARMVTELTPSESPALSHWNWLGIHSGLIATALLCVFVLFLRGLRSLPTLILILIAIITGWSSGTVSWSNPDRDRRPQIQPSQITSGAELVFFPSDPAPTPQFFRELQVRGIGWKMSDRIEGIDPQKKWALSRTIIEPGQSVNIVGESSFDDWTLTDPSGQKESLPIPIKVKASGIWTVTDSRGRELSFRVLPPIEVYSVTPKNSSLNSLFDDPRFDVKSYPENDLPHLGNGALVAWNGEELSRDTCEKIRSWVETGGTIFAASGHPICPDEETRIALGDILGAPLPAPREEDLDMGVLLLDLSGSLIGEAATTMLESAITILDDSAEGIRWGVAGFRDSVSWLVKPGTPIDPMIVNNLTTQIRSGGGTRLGQSLLEILPALKNHSGSKRVLVVTDGRTSPANWQSIGNQVNQSGIELEILLVGELAESSAVAELSAAAGGIWQSAINPIDARIKLSRWINDDSSRWKKTQPPLIQNERALLTSGFSADCPPPLQCLTLKKEWEDLVTADSVWSDSIGNNILTSNKQLKGEAILWWSGFDPLRLGENGNQIIHRIRDMLATSLRRKLSPDRIAKVAIGSHGESVLLVERLYNESMQSTARVLKNESDPEVDLLAKPGSDFYHTTYNLGSNSIPTRIETGEEDIASISKLLCRDMSSMRWLGVADSNQRAPGGQPEAVFLILAALLWLSTPVRRV